MIRALLCLAGAAVAPCLAISVALPLAASALQPDGYETLLKRVGERYSKHGWNHYGPGHFVLDPDAGVLESRGGMGLLWYSAKQFADFVLELEFRTSRREDNSGIFLRVPGVPTSDDYVHRSLEIQINDAASGVHQTGAVYDAVAPTSNPSRGPGEWNQLRITFRGRHLQVVLNGELTVDWLAEPRGKVREIAERGYIGLQNHDDASRVAFRNLYVRELLREES